MKNIEGIKFIIEGSPNSKLKSLRQEKWKISPFYIPIQQNVHIVEKTKIGNNFFFVDFNLFIFALS